MVTPAMEERGSLFQRSANNGLVTVALSFPMFFTTLAEPVEAKLTMSSTHRQLEKMSRPWN